MAEPGVSPATQRRPLPTQAESPFGIDEIFFSTTDRKGLIRSGNSVFARVSGYSRAELVGYPHNIVRHPDMPRAVFKLFWDELQAGRPIAAYVKNMAKSGNYYWVMATAVPCDGGYLSVRIKPSSPPFDTARELYAELVALEQEIEGGDIRRRKQAVDASLVRLHERLSEAGFESYAGFERAALIAEVKHRAELLARSTGRRQPTPPTGGDPALVGVLQACSTLDEFLVGLMQRFVLNDQLVGKARFVIELAEDVRLFALNALLAATRVGDGGATLQAVATLMQARCDASGAVAEALNGDVAASVDLLGSMFVPVATTRLQAEILMVFVRELLGSGGDARLSAADLGALALCLVNGIGQLSASIVGLDGRLRALVKHVANVSRDLSVLGVLELNGRIEAAHTTGAESVVTLFHTIGKQIATADVELNELARLGSIPFANAASEAKRCEKAVVHIRECLALLACA
jgi:PAS domain S-box-containing protein